MTQWEKIRLGLLIVTTINIVGVLGKNIFAPTPRQASFKNYDLPGQISLNTWQFIHSEPLEKATKNHILYGEVVIPGRKYIYQQNQDKLEVYTRYVRQANGDVSELITADKSIDVNQKVKDLILKEQTGMGSYALFTYENKAHLSACINPVGITTFRKEDFRAKAKQNTVSMQRILPWIIEGKSLVDWRCFWTHLSIPLNNQPPNIVYKKLENFWFVWHNYWLKSYPSE